MKIVCTSDTHFPLNEAKVSIPDGDVLLLVGDFMYTGYVDEWHKRVHELSKLPHPVKLFVPGNHDIHVQLYSGPAMAELRRAGVALIGPPSKHYGNKIELVGGLTIGACPYVTNLPGWAFNTSEESIWDYLDHMGRVDILASHSPPRGLLDKGAGMKGGHYGLQSLRRYINKFEPDYLICGHVHEGYGRVTEGKTEVINVSMCNLDYEMVNPPVVIEV